MKKEIIVKKSAVVKWELPEVSLDVNEVGYFISISCKTVRILHCQWWRQGEVKEVY